MPKVSEFVNISDKKQIVTVFADKASTDEIVKARELSAALGYKFVTKVKSNRKASAEAKRDKKWFLEHCADDKERAEFEKQSKSKEGGSFFIARKWFYENHPELKPPKKEKKK